jgi:hypothetical protein
MCFIFQRGESKRYCTLNLIKQHYTRLGNVITAWVLLKKVRQSAIYSNYVAGCTILINLDDIISSKGGKQKALLLQS